MLSVARHNETVWFILVLFAVVVATWETRNTIIWSYFDPRADTAHSTCARFIGAVRLVPLPDIYTYGFRECLALSHATKVVTVFVAHSLFSHVRPFVTELLASTTRNESLFAIYLILTGRTADTRITTWHTCLRAENHNPTSRLDMGVQDVGKPYR